MQHDNDNGPCACGAWHHPGDLEQLRRVERERLVQRIKALELDLALARRDLVYLGVVS